ncbi:MAG: Hsp20/alpha crystallin family protein [Candidatus Brockarchaeota archaeon]|nr:Hsp20/alpha crystallin family protein [Candidatus Brockarchaeota archaeon]
MAWDDEFWDIEPFRRWRRRSPFFRGSIFEEMDRIMEEAFREFGDLANEIPKELIREKKLPDGSTVREMGPFVYGYSVTVGPDGKPVVREFGNLKPGKPSAFGPPRPMMEVKGKREPLTDVVEEEEVIRVIAEVPGVEKSDIKLSCSEDLLTISVDTEKRKYYKEVKLPSPVDPKSAKASHKNGILEVVLNKTKKKPEGHRISIE